MKAVKSISRKSPIDQVGRTRLLVRNEKIFWKGQVAKHIYKVEVGCVRTYTKHSDGRRLILGFYFAGDYFGLEMRKKHNIFAEATTPSSVLIIERKRLASLTVTHTRVSKHMLDITDERVARFLLEMTKQDRKKEVYLQMSRRDIADHLDLTIETVARALTRLNKSSAISVLTQRRVVVHFRKLRVA